MITDANKLNLLNKLGMLMNSTLDLQTIFDHVYEAAPAVLEAHRASILLYDKKSGALVSDALWGIERTDSLPEPSGRRQRLDWNISGDCFMRGHPIVINDCSQTNLIPIEWVERLQLRSTVAVPILSQGCPIGVLRLDDCERTNAFDTDDVEFLCLIAAQLGIAIHNALLLRDVSALEERYRSLFDNAPDVYLVTDVNGHILECNQAATPLLGYSQSELIGCSVFDLLTEESRPSAREGFAAMLNQVHMPQTEAQAVCKDGRALDIIMNGRMVFGAHGRPHEVYIIAKDNTENQKLERQLMAANQELQELAIRDGLTRLYNHRHLQQELASEFERAQRYDYPLCCLMLDLDYFKNVNDTYGHPVGDFVLVEMANLLRAEARASDVVARYGGEEFCVLLPHTPLCDARAFAERLRRMVEEHLFRHEQTVIEVTTSIGIASTEDNDTFHKSDLILHADLALYAAKDAGRNRVCAWADAAEAVNASAV